MFLLWLKRMMDELPQEFLEPEYLKTPPPSDQKPVSQLTEEERRLLGVVRQLYKKMQLELDAHEAHHPDPDHSLEKCRDFNISQYKSESTLNCLVDILVLSIQKRLSLPENEFIFNGNDIYAIEDAVIEQMRAEFEMRKQIGQGSGQFPDSFFDPIDPKKGN